MIAVKKSEFIEEYERNARSMAGAEAAARAVEMAGVEWLPEEPEEPEEPKLPERLTLEEDYPGVSIEGEEDDLDLRWIDLSLTVARQKQEALARFLASDPTTSLVTKGEPITPEEVERIEELIARCNTVERFIGFLRDQLGAGRNSRLPDGEDGALTGSIPHLETLSAYFDELNRILEQERKKP